MEAGCILLGGTLWAARAERASAWAERLRGLLGRRALGVGGALVIERCGSVHTVGMRFALDLVFLDRRWRVVRVVRDVQPGRLCIWGGWRAARVVEGEAGGLDVGTLRIGDVLEWAGQPPGA